MEQTKATNVDSVVIRFSGDSGDGMQLTGTLFSNLSAILGNEISTFPDFPSEIRKSSMPAHWKSLMITGVGKNKSTFIIK